MVEPSGLRLWGRTESDTTEATQQEEEEEEEPKVHLNRAAALWKFSVTTTFSPVFSGNSNPKGWISVNDRN